MSLPIYFQQFPSLDYLTEINKAGIGTFTKTANIFRRLRLRDTIFKFATFYYNYEIKEGELPEDIARKEYGDEGLYWLILQVNDIVDFYNQWPMSDPQLNDFILSKYGSWDAANDISHYETVETKNDNGDIVLPAGIRVSSDFIFYYFPDPTNKIISNDGDYVKLSSLPVPVTFSELERRNNEKKKTISLLDSKYVTEYLKITRRELKNVNSKKSEVDLSDF